MVLVLHCKEKILEMNYWIYMHVTLGLQKKKKKKKLRKTENIFFRLLNLGEFLS